MRPFTEEMQKAWDGTMAAAFENVIRVTTKFRQAFLKPFKIDSVMRECP